ncbi:MAG: hypothetical protein V1918_09765 [Planctomycetota bacterium]
MTAEARLQESALAHGVKARPGSIRLPARAFHAPRALHELIDQVQANAGVFPWMHPLAYGTLASLLSAAALALFWWWTGLFDGFSAQRFVLFLAMAAPGGFAAWALFAALANRLFGWALGLSEAERRFLALALPRPVFLRLGWSDWMRNWLYRGESLLSPSRQSPAAYIHVFLAGDPLQSLEEETALWETLRRTIPYTLRDLCLPGETLRQVQAVKTLPRWSIVLEELTDGYGLGEVLDENYGAWARGFLMRARRRLCLRPGESLDFVLAYLPLPEGKEALVASVWPRTPAEAVSEVFSEPRGELAA